MGGVALGWPVSTGPGFGSVFGPGAGETADVAGAVTVDGGAAAEGATLALFAVEAAGLDEFEEPLGFVPFVEFPLRYVVCAGDNADGDAEIVSGADGGASAEALAIAEALPMAFLARKSDNHDFPFVS